MRFKLNFNLENSNMPIDYRRCILSFIKLSLSNYGEEYLKKFYNEKDNIIKNYTFSVFFKNPKFESDKIIIEDKRFEINMSIENYEVGIIIYNAINGQKYKKFSIYQNSWTLQNINMLNEKEIKSEDIIIKFLSPLCVRSRVDNKDFYYSYLYKEFQEILKINIKEQLKITDFPKEIIDNFEISPIDAKKVIIKNYEKNLECSTGIFKMHGNIDLLNYLYKSGMGSKHSQGFGMFQIV